MAFASLRRVMLCDDRGHFGPWIERPTEKLKEAGKF